MEKWTVSYVAKTSQNIWGRMNPTNWVKIKDRWEHMKEIPFPKLAQTHTIRCNARIKLLPSDVRRKKLKHRIIARHEVAEQCIWHSSWLSAEIGGISWRY
jgi:hypothetical protein